MGYSETRIIENFDTEHNLFYTSIHPEKKGRGGVKRKSNLPYDQSAISNIVVYDIESSETNYLFENPAKGDVVTHFLFEKSYDKEKKEIEFNRGSTRIKNNQLIAERNLVDKLLVCQWMEKEGRFNLWQFHKSGINKTLIAEFGLRTDWLLDVRNRKIRLIGRKGRHVEIRDIGW